MVKHYDYIPPGKRVHRGRLVNVDAAEQNPYEEIERLKAQVAVLSQRVQNDEVNDLAVSLENARKELALLRTEGKKQLAQFGELSAVVEAQRETIAKLDEEARRLRSEVRKKKGEDAPPLSPDMKEVAELREALAAANAKILDLETAGPKGKKER